MNGEITISKREYMALRLSAERLGMLEAGGVDNWEHYGDSLYPMSKPTIEDIEKDLTAEIGAM